jgi:hypothetical protein
MFSINLLKFFFFLSLREINTGIWSSRLGARRNTDIFTFKKETLLPNPKKIKPDCVTNGAESSKGGLCPKKGLSYQI